MWLHARIQWDKDKPGAWYVPTGIDEDYLAQVVNERYRIARGKREWIRTGNRQNHYGDCEVGAAVIADICNVRAMTRIEPREGGVKIETVSHPPKRAVDPRMQRRVF